jgi:hypothetical protein
MVTTPTFPLRRTLALLALAVSSLPLAAAQITTVGDYQAPQAADIATGVQAQAAAARVAAGPHANEVFANPYSAYPPSCLVDGVPLNGFNSAGASDIEQGTMTLLGDPAQCLAGGNAAECNYQETVTVTLYHLDCSGGKSVSILEFARPSTASTTLYPTLPLVSVTQGTKSLNIRYADDPNTVLTTTYANQPLAASDSFVLENFYAGSTQFDYNQAYTLTLTNTEGHGLQFPMPAYAAPTNPDAMEISGYMSTNWSNPNENGEGMVLQVYDDGDHATRTLTFAWFTYDKNGMPLWLYGQTTLPIGAKLITAPTVYFQGGSFAPPSASGTVANHAWGFVTFTFPDCGHMNIAFNSTANPPAPIPSGQGSRVYTRVADVNGLVCQ